MRQKERGVERGIERRGFDHRENVCLGVNALSRAKCYKTFGAVILTIVIN
jgi:hypothetical protein